MLPPPGVFTELEAEVERLYGITQCVLVEARETEEAVVNDLGIAAADYLMTSLLPTETSGLSSWSATGLSAAQHMRPFRGRDICARYFDADGRAVDGDVGGRIVGITEEQLRRIPRRVAAAGGERKLPAIRGALRGHWVDVLITDSETAGALMG